MSTVLRLGTRGSALALWQANHVADLLRRFDSSVDVEIVVIKTTGDVRQDVALRDMAGKGVFVREIEAALLRSDIDLAVHSAKDLPSTDTPGTVIAAFCERADPRDALISPTGTTLLNLPQNALVATSAPRRIAQLKYIRPDLRFTEMRGNIDTRLNKLEAGAADALILACAGLDRLGRGDVITERLSPDVCLPQVGQASVAVQIRDNSEFSTLIVRACAHPATHDAVRTERRFLSLLGGGCTAPVAAHATVENDVITLRARVAAPDGSKLLEASAHEAVLITDPTHTTLAETVYTDLIHRGAVDLLNSTAALQ